MAERPSDKSKSKPSSSKRKDEGSDEEDPELKGLTQLQKEQVLMQRHEKEQKEKKLQELKGGNKGNMASKLNELQNKRQTAKDKKERLQAENRDSEDDSESEGEIGNDKRRRKNDGDEDYVVDERVVKGSKPEKKRRRSPSQERKSPEKSQAVTMESLEKIRLSRKNLALLCSHPHFEETVKKAFVRVTHSSTTKPSAVDYLIAEIVGVKDYPKVYQVDDKETNKILVLKHGAKETPMKICFVSNGEFTGAEFTKWINRMQREGQKTPSVADIEERQRTISKGLNKRYTDEEIQKNIDQRIQEKQKKGEPLAAHEIEILENRKFTMERKYFEDEKDYVLKKEIDKLDEIIKREKNRLKSGNKSKAIKKEEDKSILNEMDEMFGEDEEEEEKPAVKEKNQKSSKDAQRDYDRGREVVHEEEEEKTEREKQIEDMKKKGLSVAELYEEMKKDFIKAHKVDLSIDKLIDEWDIGGETVA